MVTRGNRLAVLGVDRVRAILDYYYLLPEEERPAYMRRIRQQLQVVEPATDEQILQSIQDWLNANG
jgi:hypothetical protein